MVIALVVTPEGFPLAYEVLAGNTSDKTTLKEFLHKIETQYGKAERIWVMDRGIPTEQVLTEMRQSHPPVYYLVGTPKGRLTKLEQPLLSLAWQAVRPGVEVKLLAQEQELYILAQSQDRIHKERAMRQRQLRALVKRLKELQQMKLSSTTKTATQTRRRQRALSGCLAADRISKCLSPLAQASRFGSIGESLERCAGAKDAICCAAIFAAKEPAELWQFYIQLVEIEAAFKNLKDDLALRPSTINWNIASKRTSLCLDRLLSACHAAGAVARVAGGHTARAVLDKFAAIQMLDVQFPTTDGRSFDSKPLHRTQYRS